VISGKVREGKRIWWVIGVYAERSIEGVLRELEDATEEGDAGVLTIIGGDFNARTGERGSGAIDGEGEITGGRLRERNTKDSLVNKEGRRLVKYIEGKG